MTPEAELVASQRATQHEFSPRQRQIMPLFLMGYTNVEIAQELGLSATWIKDCLIEMSLRTGAENRVQLALYLVGALEHL